MIKLSVFVPETHLEAVKQAMFHAGAGKMGKYECCSWQSVGAGQFKPLAGADPYLGEAGQVCHVVEYQLEMICADEVLTEVISALKQAHPYEEPAYAAWPLLNV